MQTSAAIRAAMPAHLCPEGFDVIADYLTETRARDEVWSALRHAQSGAVNLRACANDALRLAKQLEERCRE